MERMLRATGTGGESAAIITPAVTPLPGASPTPGTKPRRRWLRRLALLLGSTLVMLLLAEGALWALDLYPPMAFAYPGEHANRTHPTFVDDVDLGWRSRPELDREIDGEGGRLRYMTDEHGRRSGPDRPHPDACEHTVVLAGDSFTWGVGVVFEHSLAGLIESGYRNTRIENLAQPGYAVDQIVLSLEQQGLPLQPDLVIVAIYPPDLTRSHTSFRSDLGFNKPSFALRRGELVALTAADRPSAATRFLERNSRLLGLWRRAQRNVGFRHGIGSWWSLNEALLDRLHRATQAASSRLVLVHVPFADWRAFPALTEWCRSRNVPLVDPVESHPRQPPGIYFPPAGHFTRAGHRLLLELLAPELERAGLPRTQ